MYVECLGYAQVHFTKRERRTRTVTKANGTSRTQSYYETIHYKNEEEYFNKKIVLTEGGKM